MAETLALFRFSSVLLDFVFYYPLFMAYLWILGGVYYHFHRERMDRRPPDRPPELAEHPFVSILIPCYDEAQNVRETIAWACAQEYPHYEVIAVNDGSTDTTGEILEELRAGNPRLRVIHHDRNQGKAVGLRTAALAARGEYLVSIDGDALLDPHACTWIVRHFLSGPRVGAVTGNPRVRTRSTLLGKIQVGEFSAINAFAAKRVSVFCRMRRSSRMAVAALTSPCCVNDRSRLPRRESNCPARATIRVACRISACRCPCRMAAASVLTPGSVSVSSAGRLRSLLSLLISARTAFKPSRFPIRWVSSRIVLRPSS